MRAVTRYSYNSSPSIPLNSPEQEDAARTDCCIRLTAEKPLCAGSGLLGRNGLLPLLGSALIDAAEVYQVYTKKSGNTGNTRLLCLLA